MAERNLLWKSLLILGIVALAVFFSYPPEDKVNLGLDLQGGAHIRIQVDTNSALKFELDQTGNRIGNVFKDEGITFLAIAPNPPATLAITGLDPSRLDEAEKIIRNWTGDWQIQKIGNGEFRASISSRAQAEIFEDAVATSLLTLRKRVDSLGVAEPIVQREGVKGDRILVQLPGVSDLNRIKDILKDVALLEWKAVTYPPGVGNFDSWIPPSTREGTLALFGGALPPDTDIFPQSDRNGGGAVLYWPLKKVSVVSGGDLKGASARLDQWGSPAVQFDLSQDAGRRFEAATRENQGKKMAIVLTNNNVAEVISAPGIREVIRDTGIINGGFTAQTADALALQLRSGALPATLNIIEERTVGPSLGRDSIRKGLISGIAGFLGVMLFMVIYYRFSGVNAVVALALNVLLVFGALGALPFFFSGAQATLTLPGIAGLILTVGMAVDSNVLIFERIREEMRNGKTVRSAVDQGFGRAFMTILDCNVTTLVAAFFLFSAGTGPVKGFAVTLTIGLLASMFTAVFVSRQIFEWVLSRKGRSADSLSI